MKFFLLFPIALAAACGEGTILPEADRSLASASLVASAGPDGILLDNRSGKPLRISVVDSLFFENGLASWCTGQDDCGIPLGAGEQRLIPADEVVGPAPRQKAVQVHWWEPGLGTPQERAGRFQRIHLRLP